MGHRIAKHSLPRSPIGVLSSTDELEHSTYYVLEEKATAFEDAATTNVSAKVARSSTYNWAVYIREVDAMEESINFYQAEKHLYGSARLGVLHDSIELLGTVNDVYDMTITNHRIGLVNYELTNHLGNVLSTISDKPIPHDNSGTADYWLADIRQATDYSPFGVTLSGRNFTLTGAEKGRFGYTGKEGDGEVKGEGNSYDFGARMYDTRLGRWLTIDPLVGKYPGISPYNYSFNNPVIFKDPNGKDGILTVDKANNTITLETTVYLYGPGASEGVAKGYNDEFAKLTNSYQVTDANDPEKIWTVSINIKYEYAEAMAQQLEADNTDIYHKNIPEGSNGLSIGNSGGVGGETGQGLNKGVSNFPSPSVFHETFHFLGFDERYLKGAAIAGFEDDVLSNGAALYDGKVMNIRPFHFVDLLDYAIKELPDGGSKILKTRPGETIQKVTPVYSEKTGVQIGETVTFPKVGEELFQIDDTQGGVKAASTEERERAKTVESTRIVKTE